MKVEQITKGHNIRPLNVRRTMYGSIIIEPKDYPNCLKDYKAEIPETVNINRDRAFSHALVLAYNETFAKNINPETSIKMYETLLAVKNSVRENEGNYSISMNKEEYDTLKQLLNSIKLK